MSRAMANTNAWKISDGVTAMRAPMCSNTLKLTESMPTTMTIGNVLVAFCEGGTSQWKEELAMLGWFSRLRVH